MTQDNMKLEKQLIDTQYENIILKNRIKLCISYIKDSEIKNELQHELIKILKGDYYEK